MSIMKGLGTVLIRVIDFETTGQPPEADVIEAAYVDVGAVPDVDAGQYGIPVWRTEAGWNTFVRPGRKIEIEARAAHHISDLLASTGAGWGETMWELGGGNRALKPDVYCAHNADFEKQLFNPEGSQWICTYKAALRLWPDAPRHSNQVLRYYLPDCDPGEAGMPPHRALPDCRVTALILIQCLMKASVEDLVKWTGEPRLLQSMPVGKHRGKPWSEIPTDYFNWVLRQDFDEDIVWNVRQELARRRK